MQPNTESKLPTTKEVPFDVLVTVGCGCCVTHDMSGVIELMEFLANQTVPPWQVALVGKQCEEPLKAQFPWLKKLKFHKVKDAESAQRWVVKHQAKYGHTFTVRPPDTPLEMPDPLEGIPDEELAKVTTQSVQ